MMKMNTDICIVGGGIAGMSLAKTLGTLGINVVVMDRVPHKEVLNAAFDGRTTAIAWGMKQMLNQIGVWQYLEDVAEPILNIEVSDDHAPFTLDFDFSETNHPMGFIVENHYIRKALVTALKPHKNVVALTPTIARNITRENERIIVHTDTETISAKLLVGADGRNSFVRKWARIPTRSWDYGQTAFVFILKHEKPHNGFAWEKFLPDGPLASLPLKNDHSQIVWSLKKSKADAFRALSDTAFCQAFMDHFGTALGKVSLAGDRQMFPLNLIHAHSYQAERVALVSDAAHGIHPIAGQGLNLGMRDVAVLAEEMAAVHKKGADYGSETILKTYQRRRRPDVMTMIAATDSLNRLFSNKNPVFSLSRKLGLGLVNRVPPLKDFFVARAMGLGPEMPRLFRGENLLP